MLRMISKSVSSSDVWGVVTLALFVGLICTLAVGTNARSEPGFSMVNSTPALNSRL